MKKLSEARKGEVIDDYLIDGTNVVLQLAAGKDHCLRIRDGQVLEWATREMLNRFQGRGLTYELICKIAHEVKEDPEFLVAIIMES